MGFRGWRVQIPPSRFYKSSMLKLLQTRLEAYSRGAFVIVSQKSANREFPVVYAKTVAQRSQPTLCD